MKTDCFVSVSNCIQRFQSDGEVRRDFKTVYFDKYLSTERLTIFIQFANNYINDRILFSISQRFSDALSGMKMKRLLYTIERKVGGRLNITSR